MAFDHSKLLGRITEKFGSQAALANRIGWAASALSNRVNNKIHFDTDEIMLLCEVLDIDPRDVEQYFFRQKF